MIKELVPQMIKDASLIVNEKIQNLWKKLEHIPDFTDSDTTPGIKLYQLL